ncbi:MULTISPECIES: DUF2147 domain-containing protein [Rhodopseudomonas]|uniref:DUF2147 domain-containing protein n=1 Tax=Rhodopseudomonas palustris TaxID=1076 RepID=A0A0D7F1D0_RHOPL|nr:MULTISPECIES: DUF2147 domain-containing protein [Rhodopseudomonas]KIZ45512.1 hypothetical protein OO17_07855 [Rhodopseudomonas palustris]MDF3814435.1 DUF2147 domain-containing protein [Rhodopseudomonas sp. BAL398]WOK18901.1 DUF2147 domain-containing protein [Rhodopseudomonas sp. BAL398]
MKRLVVLATMLVATSAANAGDSYSFDIGGRTIHIEKPSDCDSPSCVSLSIPGIYESGPKRPQRSRVERDDDDGGSQRSAVDRDDDDDRDSKRARIDRDGDLDRKPERDSQRKPLGPPAPTANAPAAKQSLEPANGARPVAPPSTTASRTPDEPAASAATTPSAPAAKPAPVVATAPPAAPEQEQEEPANAAARPAAPASPLGIWLTEEKEGKIRIEPCGPHLCGYALKDNEKILINMKPASGNTWKGRIHDPKSGSNYDSTIALKGPDRLRVQGCAFGGMFCGGQTWSRVN